MVFSQKRFDYFPILNLLYTSYSLQFLIEYSVTIHTVVRTTIVESSYKFHDSYCLLFLSHICVPNAGRASLLLLKPRRYVIKTPKRLELCSFYLIMGNQFGQDQLPALGAIGEPHIGPSSISIVQELTVPKCLKTDKPRLLHRSQERWLIT